MDAAGQGRSPSLLQGLSGLLNEALMGFLAIAALALAMAPVLLVVNPAADHVFTICEWVIVALFAAEYVVHLALAADRKAYVLNPWRILDLVVILAPVVSLLPQVSDALRSSPILRTLRLARALLFGARAGGAIARERHRQTEFEAAGPARVTVFREAGSPSPREASWDDLLQWVAEGRSEWYHVSNLDPGSLARVATPLGLPPGTLDPLLRPGYPTGLQPYPGCSILSTTLPSIQDERRLEVGRTGVVAITTSSSLLTLSRRPADLQGAIAALFSALTLPSGPVATRLTYALLRLILTRHKEVLSHLERFVRDLEAIPVRQGGPSFFEGTFRLEKELAAEKADLWRLKGLLKSLGEERVRVHGAGSDDRAHLRALADEAEGLFETVAALREGLVSLIDLHMNVASFEMNKVMRVLAIVSVLGLIPAVIGGMLGMNLQDNPWPATLPQVSFGISVGMLLCLYIFFAKGWMR